MAPEEQTSADQPGAVSAADHEAGFKDIEVLLRTGARAMLRLTAPSALDALTLYRDALSGKDVTNPLLSLCTPTETQRKTLETADVDSLVECMAVAMALAWGLEKQKKMLAAASALQSLLPSNNSSTTGGPSASPSPERASLLKRALAGLGRVWSRGARARASRT